MNPHFELPSKETYKLDNVLKACEELHFPERDRKTVLVAGTNGKGSTCFFLTHLLMAAGFKVGTYTSPHVLRRTERIRLNGAEISEELLQSYEREYDAFLTSLTYFERMTVLTFLIFRDQKVDWQILEVGLGGRLDATNVCSPDISVITRIDYDHQEILGNKLSQIAFEKAGIMRPKRPVFLGPQRSTIRHRLFLLAKEMNSEVIESKPFLYSKRIESRLSELRNLLGEHQEQNARLAIASFLRILMEASRFVNEEKICQALSHPLWPGRIQILRENPLFIVDGGHNPNAVETLCQFLRKKVGTMKFACLFGLMRDKSAARICRELRPWVNEIHLPEAFYPERQMSAAYLTQVWKSLDYGLRIHKISDLDLAVRKLWKADIPVLAVGSFYLSGKVLQSLAEEMRTQP